ncbi:MAG: nucleotidyl transferase AbiEii/AbiGii toxin family protein, partial [Chlamydiae bacterium]|nr:nucleotidyl transferase AbiEii/AbiGii toxin family protein [Chlamydiota bacterium]
QEMLKVGVHADFLKGIHPEMMIRIKIEVDTRPPISYACEQKFLAEPLPVSIKCVNEESLFAAKMQAAFFRTWKNRVKGRDWYDIVWFIRRKIPFNLEIFSALMAVPRLSKSDFLEIAKERIAMLDVDLAIEDILHFVKDQESIRQSWSKDFFKYWMERIPFKE